MNAPASTSVNARSKSADLRLAEIPAAPNYVSLSPRSLKSALQVVEHAMSTARYQTPLRYPGAKTGLARRIGELIDAACAAGQLSSIELLVEPFAGGASTSLWLVGAGIAKRALLADADPLVAAFWQVAASDTDRLIDRMHDEHKRFVNVGGTTAVDRWDYWRQWRPAPGVSAKSSRFDAAMKCLFLNRTTFSGILHGSAGPIGGRAQSSPYAIGCRYNPQRLEEQLDFIGQLYKAGRIVDVWCQDWQDTLADVPEFYPQLIPDNVVAYLDPPYVGKSSKLYQVSFDPNGGYASDQSRPNAASAAAMHKRLAQHLRRQMQYRWILSYDAEQSLITDPELYAARRMSPSQEDRELLGVRAWPISRRLVALNYTAAARKVGTSARELIFTTLPPSVIPVDDMWMEVNAKSF